jgi:peptidoglycan-N-acetylglucosamine deacetylase
MIKLRFIILWLLLAACTTPQAGISAQPSSTPFQLLPEATVVSPTSIPANLPEPTATVTASPGSSATPRPNHAPALPHIEVDFITNGSREKPYVALTFDLCQKPELPSWFDQGIVNALVKYQVPATFFLGGDWMRTHPDETLVLADNPLFELGNHSWSHPDMRELDEAQISQEILKTQNILYKLTGRHARLFRLPSGYSNDLTLSVIAWNGLHTIQWDADIADPVPGNTAENMTQMIRERVQNGSIVLMHANGRGWHTAEALPMMIEYLRGQGYILVTVSQLIGIEPLPAAASP